ncbi:MAG TPA: hypothetical protein VGJ13_12135 [Pseudonocardiaceae bacterium]|jgi:hypothetical protein
MTRPTDRTERVLARSVDRVVVRDSFAGQEPMPGRPIGKLE